MENNNLTPAQKREATMIDRYGPNWRTVVAKKAAATYKERFTAEERSAKAAAAGSIGGKKSPTKFKPSDPRAVRYGKLKKPRADDRSE